MQLRKFWMYSVWDEQNLGGCRSPEFGMRRVGEGTGGNGQRNLIRGRRIWRERYLGYKGDFVIYIFLQFCEKILCCF